MHASENMNPTFDLLVKYNPSLMLDASAFDNMSVRKRIFDICVHIYVNQAQNWTYMQTQHSKGWSF